VWVFVSLTLFGVWCWWNLFKRGCRIESRRVLLEVMLLACIALFLFPFISMSDDIAGWSLWVREDRSALLSSITASEQGISSHAGHGLALFMVVLCLAGGCFIHEKRQYPPLLETQDIPVLPFPPNARPLRAPPSLLSLHCC